MIIPLLRGAEIVGNHYRDDAGKEAYNTLDGDEVLQLQLEPDNKFDANAVKILSRSGVHIGYVPATMSAVIYALPDASRATMECRCVGEKKGRKLFSVGVTL